MLKKIFSQLRSFGILTGPILVLPIVALGNLKIEDHAYKIDGKPFLGKIVFNEAKATPLPGIIMIHDWKGISDVTLTQAKRYADEGYFVLMIDIYGKGQLPKDAKEAGALAGKFKADRGLFRKRILAGLAELKKQKNVDENKIAAIGYCFGGTGVLELGRTGAQLKGIISFHGGLDSPKPADGDNRKTPTLVLHGANDPTIPTDDLEAFEAELKRSQVEWSLVKFGNAVHSFTNETAGSDPSKAVAYNPLVDAESLAMAKNHLQRWFQ